MLQSRQLVGKSMKMRNGCSDITEIMFKMVYDQSAKISHNIRAIIERNYQQNVILHRLQHSQRAQHQKPLEASL